MSQFGKDVFDCSAVVIKNGQKRISKISLVFLDREPHVVWEWKKHDDSDQWLPAVHEKLNPVLLRNYGGGWSYDGELDSGNY